MRRIWRLLLYARPYALYSLASVVLMAVVGAMAGLRVLLIKPIIDNVLSPERRRTMCWSFRIRIQSDVIDLQFLVPHHFHNAWTVVAYALVVSAIVKSICDYLGTLLVEQGRLRHDHRPAQRSLRCHAAPVDGVLPEAHVGDADLDADQRCGARADRDVDRDERFSAAVLYADLDDAPS